MQTTATQLHPDGGTALPSVPPHTSQLAASLKGRGGGESWTETLWKVLAKYPVQIFQLSLANFGLNFEPGNI